MPAKDGVQFRLKLADGEAIIPSEPTTIAADRSFVWPFNFDLGDGVTLDYATAQLVCQIDADDATYTLFTSTGNAAEFSVAGHVTRVSRTGLSPALTIAEPGKRVHKLLLLSEAETDRLYKDKLFGRDRLLLTDAGVIVDDDRLQLTPPASPATIALLPAPPTLQANDQTIGGQADGAFQRFEFAARACKSITAIATPVRPAGELRTIRIGVAGVAAQPADADFAHAAEWRIDIAADQPTDRRLMLRVHYVGDVARLYAGDRLITDNFYNGTPFDIGLWRIDPAALQNGLTLKILPLQQDAPIHLLDAVRPDFGNKPAVAELLDVQLTEPVELIATADFL
ncbi:MAG: hypothetical protein QM754_02255 [Tepidisphaeraceae bacterium]